MKKKKLSDNELNKVTGGLIYYNKDTGIYSLHNDRTGDLVSMSKFKLKLMADNLWRKIFSRDYSYKDMSHLSKSEFYNYLKQLAENDKK